MIGRVWHGWTSRAKAKAYPTLLRTEILSGIARRRIAGYEGAHLLRRDGKAEVEFVTILWFDSMDAVLDFETAVVPPKARALLSRFDGHSAHYETVIEPGGAGEAPKASRRAARRPGSKVSRRRTRSG